MVALKGVGLEGLSMGKTAVCVCRCRCSSYVLASMVMVRVYIQQVWPRVLKECRGGDVQTWLGNSCDGNTGGVEDGRKCRWG